MVSKGTDLLWRGIFICATRYAHQATPGSELLVFLWTCLKSFHILILPSFII